jgi:hypothetical protein
MSPVERANPVGHFCDAPVRRGNTKHLRSQRRIGLLSREGVYERRLGAISFGTGHQK